MEAEAITIAAPPAIHLGPIVNPVSNETISIVIPLSAQLATVAKATIDPCVDCNDAKPGLSTTELQMESSHEVHQINVASIAATVSTVPTASTNTTASTSTSNVSTHPLTNEKHNFAAMIQKADKTKGCPFPTCSRYGRAFSRAHDLKRHIARHETRKERLCEARPSDVRTCGQCGESFLNDVILQRHMNSIHANQSNIVATNIGVDSSCSEGQFFCHVCKEKYSQFSLLSAHATTHTKGSHQNTCAFCGTQCENEEKLDNHLKEHITNLQLQTTLNTSNSSVQVKIIEDVQVKIDDDGDDFLLEEMLLLNKNPRISQQKTENSSTSSSSSTTATTGKIRCDYCSKTFKTKWTLSSHVAAHEGRFQFGCNRCGKKFVRKSHYDGHVRSHEAARPYVCDQCGKTFKELKHRREHTKRKHPGNQIAIQNLLDSISACVNEEASMEQAKLIFMSMDYTT